MTVLVNKRELAKLLGVSLPTMSALIDRYPDFPVEQRGGPGVEWKFRADVAKAFIADKKAEAEASSAARNELLAQFALPLLDTEEEADGPSPTLSAQDRLAQARALLAEDKLAKERGFLVAKSDMRARLTPVWATLGAFLQSLPADLAERHNLPGAVVRDMRARIAQQQRELHARLLDLLPADAAPQDDADDA